MGNGEPLKEYEDLSSNLRHYGNLQFAQLTVFIAITAGLLSVIFRSDDPISCSAEIVLKLAGLLLSALFLVMSERVTAHWLAYWKRAKELEKLLGFKQYTDRPVAKYFSNTNAVRGVYLLTAILWISSIIMHSYF